MSLRNIDETAFHILMPKLDESVAQNDIERMLLNELQESIRIHWEYKEKLSALNIEINKAEGEYKKYLKKRAKRIAARIDLEEATIFTLKKDPYITTLYEREKAKLSKDRKMIPMLNIPVPPAPNCTRKPWRKGRK